MLALALAGCAPEVLSRNGDLRATADDVSTLGTGLGATPILLGSITCPVVECAADCPLVADPMDCYDRFTTGPAELDPDSGCLEFWYVGLAEWVFESHTCAANDEGYLPEGDAFPFSVLPAERVTAAALDVEGTVEATLSPGPAGVFPAGWRQLPGARWRIVEPGPFRLFPRLVDDALQEVAWTLDQARADATGGIDAVYVAEDAAVEIRPEAGDLGDVRFAIEAADAEWTLAKVEGVEADAPAELEVVAAYYRDTLTGAISPAGARAVVRDDEGRLLWGTPVQWTLDEGVLAIGDPEVPLPGPDYVTLLDACVKPSENAGAHTAVLRATWHDLTATVRLEWSVPEAGSDEGWKASDRCVDASEVEGEDPTGGTTTPTGPEGQPGTGADVVATEFIAGSGGCGCSGGGPPGVLGAIGVGWLIRRSRRTR